jgi:hypothetical protein
MGEFGGDTGPSSRTERSDPKIGIPRNAKEEEWGFEMPDYYGSEKWDNQPTYKSLMEPRFDPWLGEAGCPTCGPGGKAAAHTYIMSITPQCDGSKNVQHMRDILKLPKWWLESSDFLSAMYKEKKWIGAQVGSMVGAADDVVIIVPPCFAPRLSNTELDVLNRAVYELGASIMVVGGLQGANFISQNLAGMEGHGYVDQEGIGAETFSEKFDLDAVFSDGPFIMQNAAANTEFFYGPHTLEGVGQSTVGIPVRQLPPETKHYYMSADEISAVFEIPAGKGRILFLGYDFLEMAPHWIEALLLANRELQIQARDPDGRLSPVGFEAPAAPPSPGDAPAAAAPTSDAPAADAPAAEAETDEAPAADAPAAEEPASEEPAADAPAAARAGTQGLRHSLGAEDGVVARTAAAHGARPRAARAGRGRETRRARGAEQHLREVEMAREVDAEVAQAVGKQMRALRAQAARGKRSPAQHAAAAE